MIWYYFSDLLVSVKPLLVSGFVLWTRYHRTVSHNILLSCICIMQRTCLQCRRITETVLPHSSCEICNHSCSMCWFIHLLKSSVHRQSSRHIGSNRCHCEVEGERESDLIFFWSWIIAFLWHEAKRNKNNLVCCKRQSFFLFFLKPYRKRFQLCLKSFTVKMVGFVPASLCWSLQNCQTNIKYHKNTRLASEIHLGLRIYLAGFCGSWPVFDNERRTCLCSCGDEMVF